MHLRNRTIGYLLLFFLALANAGCCLGRHCGDASVLSCSQPIGHQGERHYLVSLPAVSLARPSLTRFKVRGLKPARYDYTLVMPLPRISPEESWQSKGRVPTWAAAVVGIRFLRTDGSIVAAKKYNLGESIANSDWPEDGRWQLSLSEMVGIANLCDYDVEIQVITPSHTASDTATLEADAFEFSR